MKFATLVLVALGLGLAALYAVAQDPIPLEKQLVYSHKKHIERGYKCQSCHPGITESDQAEDRNLPLEATCRACHDGIIIDDDCTLCHHNMLNLEPLPNPERDIIFSHKLHFPIENDCYVCHAGIERTDYCKGEYLPEMHICMDCHDGAEASAECETCHGNVPRHELKPKNHNETWLHAHRSEARDSRGECKMCHVTADCQDCHEGYNILLEAHEADYLLKHALDAKVNASDCASCHNAKDFCQECHRDAGVDMPLNHVLDPMWTQIGHARAAVSDIETCATCHNGPTSVCITCHQEGSGNNPHPSQYADRMGDGPWHDDDGYMCYYCHIKQDDQRIGFCGYCHN